MSSIAKARRADLRAKALRLLAERPFRIVYGGHQFAAVNSSVGPYIHRSTMMAMWAEGLIQSTEPSRSWTAGEITLKAQDCDHHTSAVIDPKTGRCNGCGAVYEEVL